MSATTIAPPQLQPSAAAIKNRELTKEVAVALQNVNINTIKAAVKVGKFNPTSNAKAALIQNFEDVVIKHGISEFVSRLQRKTLKITCRACEIENPRQRALADEVLRVGITDFLALKCDVNLLREFGKILGLDKDPVVKYLDKSATDLEREIADEIMLIGMDHFFSKMPFELVKDICKDLALTPQGKSQTDYIDCVMAHFFNLEPQDKLRRLEEEKRLQANGSNGSFLSGYDENSDGAKGGAKHEFSDLLQSDNMNYEYEDDEEDDEDDDEKEFVPPKSVMKKAKTPRKSLEKDLDSSGSDSSEDSAVINAKKRKYDEMKESDEDNSEVSEKSEDNDEEEVARKAKRGKYVSPPLTSTNVVDLRSNIKKGITGDDLQNLYNLTDLQEYCKQNDIIHTGKKPQLIKRIIQYLETGQKTPKKPKGKRSRGAKRKSEEGDGADEDKSSRSDEDESS